MQVVSLLEVALLLAFDGWWWQDCKSRGFIVARYDTVHFGREEMQAIFENSLVIRRALKCDEVDLNVELVHNRIMGAVICTTGVLENAFRCAYLATPVYTCCMSNRKALRDKYDYVGCNLDTLIKQIRVLLEKRNTTGLLSLTTSGGTAEAALHNNIESILSIAVYYESGILYNVAARIASMESKIEKRLAGPMRPNPETVTRERVCYIDARNAMFWLLWVRVVKEWVDARSVWHRAPVDKFDDATATELRQSFPEQKVDVTYIIAFFLSRCRYCSRYGIGARSERDCYVEVAELVQRYGRHAIDVEFSALSRTLEEHRGLSLLEWTEKEYGLKWATTADAANGSMECKWDDENGRKVVATCNVAFGIDHT